MDGSFRNARADGLGRPPVLLAGLLIGCSVEGNEQDQVRTQRCAASEGGEFLATALANVRERREVHAGGIIVCGIINKALPPR